MFNVFKIALSIISKPRQTRAFLHNASQGYKQVE